MNKYLKSSDGSGKLSTTIKGLLVGIVPLVINFTALDEASAMQLVEGLTTVIAGAVVIYGVYKKYANGRLHG